MHRLMMIGLNMKSFEERAKNAPYHNLLNAKFELNIKRQH